EPGLRATLEIHNPSGMPRIEDGRVEGPYNVTGISETPSRQKIFTCRPSAATEEPACAEKIVTTMAERAYRRPVDKDDIAPLMAFYDKARANGGDFDAGIHDAVARTLVSPWFLFRTEADSPDAPPGSVHQINDYELASRLSFFLWSSVPPTASSTRRARSRRRFDAWSRISVRTLSSRTSSVSGCSCATSTRAP